MVSKYSVSVCVCVCVFVFQIHCFDAPLQPQALQDVKNIVMKNVELGIHNEGVTLEGMYVITVK